MTSSVTAVLQRRDRLRDFFRQFWNCSFGGDDFQHLIPDLQKLLPKAGHDVLFESLRQYSGREISKEDFDRFAWLLAGNLHRLQNGLPVAEWQSQVEDEWVPVQVTRVFPTKDQFGNRAYKLWLVVLSGTPTGKIFQAIRKPNFLSAMSSHVGFSRRYGKMPYKSGYQYMSLRFMVRIVASRSQQEITFDTIDSSSGLLTWNKRILKQRSRLTPCPNQYTHPCHRCIIGSDRCLAATHQKTYVPGPCASCGEQTAWFDPELATEFCIECEKKQAWQNQ